jgi:cytochrome c biogenesis protein CcmG/thiol:disulfide interchange protein DsbE
MRFRASHQIMSYSGEPKAAPLMGVIGIALLASVAIKTAGRGFADGEVAEIGSLVVGSAMPDAELTDLAEVRLGLTSSRGKPMLLEFGATWCGPCRALLGPLRKVEKELADTQLEVYSIDVGETAEVVKAHYANRVLGGVRVVLDQESRVTREFGVQAFPTLVLVDARGIIRFIRVGGLIDANTLKSRVEKALVR